MYKIHVGSSTWKLKHWYKRKVESCNFGKSKSLFFLYHGVWVLRWKRKCRYLFGTIQSFLCEKRVVPPIKIPLNCTVWGLSIRQNHELCHKLIKYPQRQYIFYKWDTVIYKQCVTLYNPKMYPHTKFRFPTANNIGDVPEDHNPVCRYLGYLRIRV